MLLVLLFLLLNTSESFASEYRYSIDKHFPESTIDYDPLNPEHLGWKNYLSPSLHGQNKSVLTFDDGPHPTRTPKLLDLLKKYQVKATFFTVGELAEQYPEITKRIVDEGHILAGHDWRHDDSRGESLAEFQQGLTKSVKSVKTYYQKREIYYRFPYGSYGKPYDKMPIYHHLNAMKEVSQKLFGENCINFVFWDIDTSDWVWDMTSGDIFQTLKANFLGGTAYKFVKANRQGRTYYTKNAYQIINPLQGGVILMHDIHAQTIEAMELFLPWARDNNIEIVPLNEVKEFEYTNEVCELLNPL